MDLKGSLIDTNLKIYPPQKLLNFLKTIPIDESFPINILKITNKEGEIKGNNQKDIKPSIIQLNNCDIDNLSKIKKAVNKSEVSKLVEEKPISDSETVKEPNEQNSKADEKESPGTPDGEAKIGEQQKSRQDPFLFTSDIDWLFIYLQKRKTDGEKDIPYLHVLLEGATIETPENKTIKRNPVLEARCVKLRSQQESRDYRKMTKGVDNVRMRFPEDSISYQLKQINRQLIAIGQFILSIFAGFLFGFKGVEWMIGNLDFGFRLLLGVMCSLVIALAEIYFLAKKLNEELNATETVQIGGPPKFANEPKFGNSNVSAEKTNSKEHQD